MNEIVRNSKQDLLAGEKFMPERHLTLDLHIVLVCPFLKTKKEYKTIKKIPGSRYIYKNELNKACFQHDIANCDFKNLPRRTASEKIFLDKAFNFAKNAK